MAAGRSSPGGHVITERWFFCFSKQAGVVMFSSMGWAMMMTVALLNIGGEENPEEMNDRNTHYAILYCYLLPMLVGFSLLYVGSVKVSLQQVCMFNKQVEHPRAEGDAMGRMAPLVAAIGTWMPDINCLIAGLAVQCTFGIYWIVIAVMSLRDEPGYVYTVCIDNRCPETLWLYNTQWRTYGNECVVLVDNLLVAGPDESDTDGLKQNESALVELDGLFANETQVLLESSESSNFSDATDSSTKRGKKVGPLELNHTNYDYGDGEETWQIDSKRNLTERKNLTSGTVRMTSLAEVTEDMDDAIQAILQLLSKKPFSTFDGARELRIALLGSRVLGCTENVENSMALSIVGALMWFVFLAFGNFGAFLLIREVRWKQLTAAADQEEELRIIPPP